MATYGPTKDFPAFYTRKSPWKSPYNVTSALEAAEIIVSNRKLKLNSGCLIAVPVPEEHSLDEIEDVILEGLKEMASEKLRKTVVGKEITPFLLSYLSERTDGQTLETSILFLLCLNELLSIP